MTDKNDSSNWFVAGAVLGPFVAAGFVAITTGALLLRAHVVSILWRWFIVPPFGLPALTFMASLGMLVTVGLIKGHSYSKDDRPLWSQCLSFYTTPLCFWGVGWLVHWYS